MYYEELQDDTMEAWDHYWQQELLEREEWDALLRDDPEYYNKLEALENERQRIQAVAHTE
jgi:hypothetical protein